MTPSNNMNIDEAVQFAAEAIGQGDLHTGKSMLNQVLKKAPSHPVAWMWMACCVSDEEMKRECYRRIAA
jgi:Tfp pilus assembly protein PilF